MSTDTAATSDVTASSCESCMLRMTYRPTTVSADAAETRGVHGARSNTREACNAALLCYTWNQFNKLNWNYNWD